MTLLLNIGLPVLVAVAILAMLFFTGRGLQARGRMARQAYGFGQQEARRQMQWAFLKALLAGIFALLTFFVFSAALVPQALEPIAEQLTATDTPTVTAAAPATTVITPTRAPVSTRADATTLTVTPQPTSPIPTATATETATPTTTPTATPLPTAIVNSPNGLYLREAPGGTQELELIPDGATLILLDGQEQVGDFVWQEVRTELGNEGWVAIDFILLPGAPEAFMTQTAEAVAVTPQE